MNSCRRNVSILVCFIVAIVALFASDASAQSSFRATLEGAQEVPPNDSTATGTATLSFNDATNELTLTLNFSGVTATAAHIHGPAPRGVEAGVLYDLNSGNPPTQTIIIQESQVADLRAGLWYINVHSAAFPGGEIRGQIEPATAAAVSITGRVRTANGRALVNAVVTLTDAAGIARAARSNSFGYFRFDDVPAGETYIATVRTKGNSFQPRVVTVNDEITDLEFVATETSRRGVSR